MSIDLASLLTEPMGSASLSLEAQRMTAHELVRERLRYAILSGRIKAGTRLLQAEIAEHLRVSTTPVREAMRDLATEGLIRLDAHRGAVVHSPDLSEMHEIYWLRTILEPESVRLAIDRISLAELEQAERLHKQMEDVCDFSTWALLNRSFHAVIADAARSPQLSAVLKGLRDRAALYVALSLRVGDGRMAEGSHDHRELLEALRAREVERAVAVTIRHLGATIQAVETLRTPR